MGAKSLFDRNPKKIKSTYQAVKHYFSGKGEPVQLGEETINELRNSPEYQRVVNRLVSGKADDGISSFDVSMKYKTFHIGNTNVDYNTQCVSGTCTTIFNEFVRDGFWDPLDIGIEIPAGTPFKYDISEYIITYPNKFPGGVVPNPDLR